MNVGAVTVEEWGQGGRVSQELAERLISYLAKIALSGSVARGTVTRVAASGKLLDFYRWQTEREDYSSPERAFVTLCGGPEKALAWLERNGASLHAKLSARLQPPDMATSTEEISTDGQKEP